MKKYSVLFLLLSSLVVNAQTKPATPPAKGTTKPKLIVGIVIDQMRYDYIYRFWDKFGNDGFKKLVNQGYFCKNTN